MTSPLERISRRYGSERPGMQLIDIEEAAIPVTVVQADVLAQERKQLAILDEFVVRFVAGGVESAEDIATLLGLTDDQVLEAAATQVSENNVRRREASGRLTLTPQGLEVARDLAATQPVLKRLPVAFDRLLWRIVDYPKANMLTKKEAQERGLRLLPAAQNSRIGLTDVTPESFNALLRVRDGREKRVEILQVRKVLPNTHRYLPVQLLVYGDAERGELQLAVCIDGVLEVDLGLALDKIKAVERLGLSIAPPAERPRIDDDLERRRVDIDEGVEVSDEEVADNSAAAVAVHPLASVPVRSVSVFEHAALLSEALSTAKRRLMIISPWVRSAVVTTDFLAVLERRLRANVHVTIAHGYGEDESGSDAEALRRLQNLANRFKQQFTLVRVKNTHAKILIFDDRWITTSFNWLSFRGDPNRTYRMEEGIMVQIPSKVDRAYEDYTKLIADLRI
jgi:hypothetical protein